MADEQKRTFTDEEALNFHRYPTPGKIAIAGTSNSSLGCGPQRPPRRLTVEYTATPDAKLASAGDVQVIEFQ